MLLQTNSYVVPRDRKAEHARLVRRFRQTFSRLGCDTFEVYEQVGSNWSAGESSGRFVQIMRFRDRRHQLAVQEAERNDPDAQSLIAEFCDLINFPYQRQQGLFAVGFYIGVLPSAARRQPELLEKGACAEGEIDEESASAADAEPSPAASSKPPALVEPGAAVRAPIVPPVEPGQVPIITPAPDDEQSDDSRPSEHPESASSDPVEEADANELPVSQEDEPALASADFEDISDLDDHSEPALADAPSAGPGNESAATPPAVSPRANPRWQPSDEIDDEIEGDVTTNLSDADENGEVRVADDELIQTEADFAEYTSKPAGAFDEIPAKPPVLEGTLVEDLYDGPANAVIPMNDDDALDALEMPLDSGQPDSEQAHVENEIKQLTDEDEDEILDVDPLPDPTEQKSTK